MGPFDDPDRYQLVKRRSRGMEGEVWRAERHLDRIVLPVAVKIVHEVHMESVEEWRTRWQRQTELLRSLDHPCLVRVREFFEGPTPHPQGASQADERTLYLAMNWEEGISLQDWVRVNPQRTLALAWTYVEAVAAAVDYLHSGAHTGFPVIHRDIKPPNILISGPVVRLVDFGLVRLVGDSSLTLGGTPPYMAPETWQRDFSPASDRYALGATGYFVITGKPPPDDDASRRRALARARVPDADALAITVMQMLEPSPDWRPAKAVPWSDEVASILRAGSEVAATPPPVPTKPAPETLPGRTVRVGNPTKVDPRPRHDERITFIPPDTPPPPTTAEPPSPRRRWRRVLVPAAVVATVLAIATAALATAGVWPFSTPTTTSTTPPSDPPARPPVTPSVTTSTVPPVQVLAESDPIPAGVYASARFKPQVTFQLKDGWTTTLNLSDSVDLVRTNQRSRQLSIVRVQRAYRPSAFDPQPGAANDEQTALAAIERVTDEVAWLQSLPGTDKSEIKDVTVAGKTGKTLDVSITGISYPPSCSAPCLPLFQREPAPPDNRTSAVIRFQGQRLHLEVFDIGVAKIVFLYSAPAGELQSFLTEAKSSFVVQSFGASDQLTSVSLGGAPPRARAGDTVTVTAEVRGGCIASQTGTLVSFYEGAVRDRPYGSAPITAEGRATFTFPVRAPQTGTVAVVVARYEGGGDCERSTSAPLFIPLTQ